MSLVRKQFSIGDASTFECWIYVIRGVDGRPDEFWFKGHDVAEFLAYTNPRQALITNVNEEWKRAWSNVTLQQDDAITPPNWQPHTVFISEPGLLRVGNA